MTKVLSTNIISPLGFSTEENFHAINSGKSSLSPYTDKWSIPEPFIASLFTDEQKSQLAIEGLTPFESLVYASVADALQRTNFDISSPKVIFILSSTKGNIDELERGEAEVLLGKSAAKISRKLGITTTPVVVCNACISGVSAQLLALRLLESGNYEYAIVCGADCQNKFVVSGFQSLKAVSAQPCRPFDMERTGLNLGEAAATMILSSHPQDSAFWSLTSGAVRNDAVHISNPSKTAEGCYRAITTTLSDNIKPSLISVHGTATLYNDQMESIAIKRAELSDVPTIALKGYYGHTMGATGILESILMLRCAEQQEIPATKGFEELGVSGKVNISSAPLPVEGFDCLKIISGFGGCNGALLFQHSAQSAPTDQTQISVETTHHIKITPTSVWLDNQQLHFSETGKDLLTEIYKTKIGEYPKFFKMDMLSRLAFVASELLLQAEGRQEDYSETRSVIFFNKSSSIVSDIAYSKTIAEDEYFPSPAVFVYTLPNICTGEIAIRNNYHGETSFYILEERNEEIMDQIIESSFLDKDLQSTICGWIDCPADNDFVAEMNIKIKK